MRSRRLGVRHRITAAFYKAFDVHTSGGLITNGRGFVNRIADLQQTEFSEFQTHLAVDELPPTRRCTGRNNGHLITAKARTTQLRRT